MTARPRLADLFCGDGGAARGYYAAGFDVVGIDIEAKPDITGLFPGATAAEVGLADMSRHGASQAIPPAYTEHIGRAFLEHVA